MKVTATELMKQLKYIESEIEDIHNADKNNCTALLQKQNDSKGNQVLVPLYESDYDFASNRAKIRELHKEERKIRNTLSLFNAKTKVDGNNFTISEGLVRIAELKSEISILAGLASRTQFNTKTSYQEVHVIKTLYNVEEAKEVLRAYQRELSALQVAIDKTNLNSEIEFDW